MARLLMVTTTHETLYFLEPFAAYFRAEGWQVDAMAHGAPDSIYSSAFDRTWDISLCRKPLACKQHFAAVKEITSIIKQEKYDIVHVHTPIAALLTRYALREQRQKSGLHVIYTAHGFHFHRGRKMPMNLPFLALEKLAGRWTDELVVINREDEKAAQKYRLLAKDRIHYMPGIGLDTRYYDPLHVSSADITRVRQELQLGPQEPLILMVAEFNYGKRHADALQAFSQMKHREAHLAFAGSGLLMDRIKAMTAEMGLEDRVHFLGFRNDMPTLVRASAFTILPSQREGLPRSVMESLALEVPVIGADVRGIRDLLEDGSGLLFKVGDVAEFAREMDWMLDHPEEARAMGRCGHENMRSHDIHNIIKLHSELYQKVLQN